MAGACPRRAGGVAAFAPIATDANVAMVGEFEDG